MSPWAKSGWATQCVSVPTLTHLWRIDWMDLRAFTSNDYGRIAAESDRAEAKVAVDALKEPLNGK